MPKASIINDLLSELKISMHKLEKSSKISNGAIRKAIDRDADLSLDIIEKISKAHPKVNKHWLSTGEGPILKGMGNSGKPVQEDDSAGSGIMNSIMKIFGLLPEDIRDMHAYELLQQAIDEVKESNKEKEQLLEQLKEKNAKKK